MQFTSVTFDLDGTLVDTAPEIADAVNDTLAELGLPAEPLERVQARTQGDAAVHSVKKSLGEHGDKLDAAEKDAIEAATKELEEALKGEDKDAIEAKTTALMTASQKLGEKVYAEAQAAAGAAGGAAAADAGAAQQQKPAGSNDDDIVDAEVKEVKK